MLTHLTDKGSKETTRRMQSMLTHLINRKSQVKRFELDSFVLQKQTDSGQVAQQCYPEATEEKNSQMRRGYKTQQL